MDRSRARRGSSGRCFPRRLSCLSLVVTAAALVGCSANPATGKRQLNFYSEAEEVALGRQSDAQIAAQLGLVDDPALQAWVSSIGKRLATQSERPNLPWTFKVVDDPVVNAFALPGGYIYVTRGILGHLRNESELAAVLGHEIGHVTAQHGVNQMSKGQLATGGLLVGMIVAPEGAAQAVGQLGQAGLGLLFLKYGRDDERQADDLGLRYVARTGFEPREMPNVFGVLRRVGELEGAGRIPNWMSAHPDPGARREHAQERIANGDYPRGEVGLESYLRRTDGLVFGANPRAGYFEGRTFYHPDLAFRFEVPSGWAAANETSRVIAAHPERIAQVELGLAQEKSAAEAAKKFLAQEGLADAASRSRALNGLTVVEADFSVPRENQKPIAGRAAFVEHGGQVYRLLGLYLEEQAGKVRRAVDGFTGSFSRLTDRAVLGVQPQRLELVSLPRAMSFDEFRRDHPSQARPEVLALINGIDDAAAVLPAGTLLRRVTGREVGKQRLVPEGN